MLIYNIITTTVYFIFIVQAAQEDKKSIKLKPQFESPTFQPELLLPAKTNEANSKTKSVRSAFSKANSMTTTKALQIQNMQATEKAKLELGTDANESEPITILKAA